jgi:glutaredoxin
MKKILPILVIIILVLSGLGASAISVERDSNDNNVVEKNERATHTVLGEDGTATWCYYCKFAHGALKELYAEGQLDFYYVSLVCDKNNKAYARAKNDYNLYGYPTLWWDGGRRVNVGAGSVPSAKSTYTSSINYLGSQPVKNVDINLKATWQGGTSISVECEIKNNEASTYDVWDG